MQNVDVFKMMFQDEREEAEIQDEREEAEMKNLSLGDLMENFVDVIQKADETTEAYMEEAKKWLDEIQERVAAPKTLEELITKLTTRRLFQLKFELEIDEPTMVIVDHLNTYRESDIGKTTMLRHFLDLQLLDGSNYLEAVIQLIHELDSLCANDPDEEEKDVEVLYQFRLFNTLEKIDLERFNKKKKETLENKKKRETLENKKKRETLKNDIKNLIELTPPEKFVVNLTNLLQQLKKTVV